MTQIIGPPLYTAEVLGKEYKTKEEAIANRSLSNKYRIALAKISRHEKVIVWMGKVPKEIPATDLMMVLRDCRKRMDLVPLAPGDFAFFAGMVRRFGAQRLQASVFIASLMRLRKIAYGTPAPETAEKASARKLRSTRRKIKVLVGSEKHNEARRQAKKSPVLEGCRYQDPGSGVRCGAPCTGTLCEAHKNTVPAYNGSGSHFYALNKKESNPHRR
jgi:hypothetical protein